MADRKRQLRPFAYSNLIAAAIAVALLYPLSIGPALRWEGALVFYHHNTFYGIRDTPNAKTLFRVYRPIFLAAKQSPAISYALRAYTTLWGVPAEDL
ncbi:hypothetical protein DB346_15100 [Verrucomicrobia bacterium LW23]|nr:hypothetical protein DB346_15100 [Verrucomicrobia bacterium LW23]